MLFDMQHDIEIARRSAVSTSLAQSRKTDTRSVLHTSRNLGVHRLLPQHAALALALQAWIRDHATGTLTSGTSASHAEESLLIANLPTPSAGSTGNWSLARRRTGSAAVLTSLMAAHGNVGFRPENCFFKFQRDVFTQIGATLGTAAPARTAAKKISEAEKVAEDFADILKDRRVEPARSSSTHGSMPEAVVCGSLVCVRQARISFAAFLEFLFSVGIVRIAIRMKLQRQLAIGALNFLLVGFAGDPEHFVVVAFYVAGQNGSKSVRFS